MTLKEYLNSKNEESFNLKEKLIESIDEAIEEFDWSLAKPEWFVSNEFDTNHKIINKKYVEITTEGFKSILRNYCLNLVVGYWNEIRYLFFELKERGIIANYEYIDGPNDPFIIVLKIQ